MVVNASTTRLSLDYLRGLPPSVLVCPVCDGELVEEHGRRSCDCGYAEEAT